MIALACCRAGFEGEAATDIARVAEAAKLRAPQTLAAAPASGYVALELGNVDRARWRAALLDAPPVFCRSLFIGSGPHPLLGDGTTKRLPDRVTPIVDALAALEARGDALWLEYPDTNDGKAMSTLSRALAPRITAGLRERGLLSAADTPAHAARNAVRLHVFLPDGTTAWVGTSIAESGARWPMGIAHLRMPGAAPSRSTLKLAEAIAVFLGEREHELMRAGQRAVDLGAAPGGWTWQLAQRGLRVTAVDNGALKGEIARDPLVTHVRADGFRFVPKRPVDWVLCDMVEQPSRVAGLMARWIGERHARHALFNLKLPMKKRYAEIERCANLMAEVLRASSVGWGLAVKHLYHDREEVTAHLYRRD